MERRTFLKGVSAGGLVAIAGCTDNETDSPVNASRTTTGENDEPDATITLDNVGAQAWEVLEAPDVVVEEGGQNPLLRLTSGIRYRFVNQGGAAVHPLGFVANGETVLAQTDAGAREDDPEIGYVEHDGAVDFTLTPALAADLNGYVCLVHDSMEGRIVTDITEA